MSVFALFRKWEWKDLAPPARMVFISCFYVRVQRALLP